MPWPISSAIVSGVQTLASQYNNLRLDANRSLLSKLNNSGSQRTEGDVVVFDSSAANAFKTSVLQGDPSMVGVVVSSTIAAGASGYLAKDGNHKVNVTGRVYIGHHLIPSTTAGLAMDSGSTQKPTTGSLGIATTEYTGSGTSSVYADLDIHTFTSTNLLQKLPTATPYNSVSSLTVHTFTHAVDSGTNLLVLRFSHYGAPASAVTYNGVAMTAVSNTYDAYNDDAEIYCLINPPAGAHTVAITQTSGFCMAYATNYSGANTASPFRTPLTNVWASGAATYSLSPISALLDIVIDVSAGDNSAVWTPTGANQATDVVLANSAHSLNCSSKPGTASSTVMSWSTNTSSRVAAVAVAIAGS